MTHPSPLQRHTFAGAVVSILCLLSAELTAGQFGGLFGGDKGPSYRPFKDPAGRFELEVPTKDWKLLPSGGTSLAVFINNDGPTLVIDLLRLADPLTPAEVDELADVEADRLKEQVPTAKDFKQSMLETKAGRGVLIRYSRGTGAESGVAYSVPVGRDLFRLNAVVADKLLAKFEPIIMHMIQSFKAPADPAAAKK